MPIHIKGSGGGAQKAPEITVSTNGTVSAVAGGKGSSVALSSVHDPDFIPANIKNGVTIFGVTGTLSGSAEVTERYDHRSAGFSFNRDTKVVKIAADTVRDTYGLERITGVKNLSVVVEEEDASWYGLFTITAINGSKGRFMYVTENDGEYDLYYSDVTISYSASSGMLSIQCPAVAVNIDPNGDGYSAKASVTWAID